MTENEEILRAEISNLQSQVYEITQYLEQQKILFDNMQPNVGAYSHTFWTQQQVQIGFVSQEQSINVYVDVGNGNYKQIHPVISDVGGQKQLNFDMPYTGYAIIGEPYASNTVALPCTPPVMPISEITLLVTPEPEEPIIRTGIHDIWQQ